MKTCFKCKQERPFDLFFKHKQTSDGYHSWCKNCCNEGSARSRDKVNATLEGRAKVFLQNAKKNAAKRGHVFDLTIKDILSFWELQQGVCAYSGREMTLKASQLNTVSLERIDSSTGYIPSNTVLVCQAINRMKSDFEFTDFFDLCKDVTLFLSDDNLNRSVENYK